MKLPPVHLVVSRFNRYASYSSYPVVFYVKRTGEITDEPTPFGTRIDSWVIPFRDGRGIVVHVVNGDVIVRGYRVEDRIIEDDTIIVELIDMLRDAIAEYKVHEVLGDATSHVVHGIAHLFAADYNDVKEIIDISQLRSRLEDRITAVLGKHVIILSKHNYVFYFHGDTAVKAARMYSFVTDSPIATIAEHTRKYFGRPVAFLFRNSALVCNTTTCRELPLPYNFTKTIMAKAKAITVDLASNPPTRYTSTPLPIPPILIHKHKAYILEPRGREYTVKSTVKTIIKPVKPLVFDEAGFKGYGAIKPHEGSVKVVVTDASQEEKRHDYYEDIILPS